MSWGLVAVGVSALGSAASVSGAKQDSKRAARSANSALAFEQQQYDDWKEVYGPMEENLANYYSQVTPEYYAAQGLEAFNEQVQTSQTRMQENFAQRGIDPMSGIAVSMEAQNELANAEQRATIRRDAPRQAIEDQAKFLQIGMGNNPTGGLSDSLNAKSANDQRQSAAAQQAAGQALIATGKTIGRAIDSYNPTPETPYTAPAPVTVPAANSSYITY